MIETFIYSLKELCKYLPYIYTLLFFLNIAVHKKMSSLSITLILVACAEFIIDSITSSPLMALNDPSVEVIIRLSTWLLFWCYFYALCVFLLEKSHVWLNVSKSRTLVITESVFAVLIALELLHFTMAYFFQNSHLVSIYHFGVPIIRLSMGVYLLSQFLLSIKDHYVSRTHTPSGAT